MQELVSIIIPFYNEERYIGDCLTSLAKQTYKKIEIICVDDGSTDNGVRIVKKMQQTDKRIILLQQENLNAGTARNTGFAVSKGQYVLFLDADDFFSPKLVECMLSKATDTNSDIVFCTGYGMNDATKETYKMPAVGKENTYFPKKDVFSSSDVIDGIFQLSVTWAWDKMYRSDFIRKNNLCFQKTKVCNDLAFVCLSYLLSERISYVNKHLICHRTNIASSLYSVGEHNWRCLFEALSSLEKELINKDLYVKHKKSFINLAAENIVYYLLMRFTNDSRFNSFYEYYKNELSDHYRFTNYPKEYYRDEFVYLILKYLENDCKDAFLLNCIHQLSKKNSVTLGLANSKKWMLPLEMVEKKRQVVICGDNDISKSFYQQIMCYFPNSNHSLINIEKLYESDDFQNYISAISQSIDLIIVTDNHYDTFERCCNFFSSIGIKRSIIKWINTLYSDDWLIDYII